MNIRNYKASDKPACMEVFDSNCPAYFDIAERTMFDKWLDHQADNKNGYSSPTYNNADKDAYYVVEVAGKGVIGCGGFYIVHEGKEARLAWGMIHADFHKQGYGKALYHHRQQIINNDWPGYKITLGTSQHTFPFYEKMGMKVMATFPKGYGEELDRYDMEG